MGWRGTVRGVIALSNAIDRDSRRRAKEQEREFKFQQKLHELSYAEESFAEFQSLIEELTSVHHAQPKLVDWHGLVESSGSPPPTRSDDYYQAARRKLAGYRPSLWDRLMKKGAVKRLQYNLKVFQARELDDREFAAAVDGYQRGLKDRERNIERARLAIALHPETLKNIVSEGGAGLQSVFGLTALRFQFVQGSPPVVEGDLQGMEALPPRELSLLKSGMLSEKEWTKSKLHGLYQDHVCSVAFRVAMELLAIVPSDRVVVTLFQTMLDTASGHMRQQAILSVDVPRATLAQLNLLAVDPSDCLSNFNHRMDFKKTAGFRPIQALGSSMDAIETRTSA